MKQPVLYAPVQALALLKRCGVKSSSILTMFLLALSRVAVDTISAVLFAVVLYVLLGIGMGKPAWLGMLPTFFSTLSNEVLLIVLGLALIVCKAILAPLLSRLRGQLVDRWALRVAMATLNAELMSRASDARQVHAQGRNITVNVTVSRVIMGGVFPSLDLLTEILIVTALLSYLSWHLPMQGAALLGGLLATGILFVLLQRRLRRAPVGQLLSVQEQMHRWVTDSSAGLRELQLYGRIPEVLNNYRPLARTFAELTSHDRAQQDAQGPIVELAMLFLVGGVVFGLRHYAPQTDLAAVALCSAIGLRLLPAVRRILMALQGLGYVQGSIEQLHALLNRVRQTKVAAVTNIGNLPSEQLLICEELYYSYPGATHAVLEGVNLRLGRGEWLGLVGASGAGKSTFVDLLIGQLQPTSGRLVWGREPGIGYVGAITTLFPGSLRDNIVLFGPPVDDSGLIQALSIAGLSAWLARLPAGLDTPVAQFEQAISSGERQRLGLARAIVHAGDLLILDEATAALDDVTERHFVQSLKAARPELAVLLVTHRLSALRHTNRAVALQGGRLLSVDVQGGDPRASSTTWSETAC